jgi:hypothetical protein
MRTNGLTRRLLLIVTLAGLAGCGPSPEPPPPTAELAPGETYTTALEPASATTLRMTVKARTFYAVWFSASGGLAAGLTISGDPLAAPVEVELGLLSGASTEPQATFYAQSDGDLEIEVANNAQASSGGGLIGSILLGSGSPIDVDLRIDELGTDDHGESPAEATTIVADGQGLPGTLLYGETYDYFLLPADLGNLFNVRIESTRDLTLATANVDAFGQFNFGVPTAAGNELSLTARPGVPATDQFSIDASEPTGQVLLAVKASSGLLSGSPGYADYPIPYVITIEAINSQELQSGDARSGHLSAGFTAQYFIDVPSALSRLETTLSGPDGLAVYIRKGQPASFEQFDFYLVLGGGVATDSLTIGPPQIKANRYYLTVDSILGDAADYILSVEIK